MMDVARYLQRIHAEDTGEPGLCELTQLQYKHMLHVPFENLDVMRGVWIPLDTKHYYEKIVERHRGGFCYELNGLFHWLLQQLGYRSRLVSATVMRPDGTWAMDGSHACQIVELDQLYLVDVGFGDSVRKPVPLSGEVRTDISGSYYLENVASDLYDLKRGERAVIRIDTKARKLTDFDSACRFNQTSPESHFTQKTMVSIATLSGRRTLSDEKLTVTRYGNKEERPVRDYEWADLLDCYFHIQL